MFCSNLNGLIVFDQKNPFFPLGEKKRFFFLREKKESFFSLFSKLEKKRIFLNKIKLNEDQISCRTKLKQKVVPRSKISFFNVHFNI